LDGEGVGEDFFFVLEVDELEVLLPPFFEVEPVVALVEWCVVVVVSSF